MRVHLGSDHAGFDLKNVLVAHLREAGHDVVDHGPLGYDAEDDYPPFCLAAAAGVAAEQGSVGIVLGGSGNGEAIAANKVPGVRCALVWTTDTARLAREHNDANCLSLGARQYSEADALSFVDTFLAAEFTGEERHVRRIGLLSAYEASGVLPPLP